MSVRLELNPSLIEFLHVTHNLPEDERQQIEAFSGSPFDPDHTAATFYLRPTVIRAAYYEGKELLAVAGYTMVIPGVYEDWMFTTPLAFDKYAIGMTRQTKMVMDLMIEKGARRLQCLSLASRVRAHKWYRALRLKHGGVMKAFGANGEDAIMFYRLGKANGQ